MATGVYRVTLSPSARKQLQALPRDIQERIIERLTALGNNPRPHGGLKLAGRDDAYRIRIGVYRAIYGIDDANRIVHVTAIAHRRDVYRP